MTMRLLAVMLILAVPLAAVAEEEFVYESFTGVQIGRVFLSQSQRDALDAARLLGPQEGEGGGTKNAEPGVRAKEIRPAGYIIGSGGRSRVWQDGDFVETGGDTTRSLSFPGEVRITRHKNKAKPAVSESTDSGNDDDAG